MRFWNVSAAGLKAKKHLFKFVMQKSKWKLKILLHCDDNWVYFDWKAIKFLIIKVTFPVMYIWKKINFTGQVLRIVCYPIAQWNRFQPLNWKNVKCFLSQSPKIKLRNMNWNIRWHLGSMYLHYTNGRNGEQNNSNCGVSCQIWKERGRTLQIINAEETLKASLTLIEFHTNEIHIGGGLSVLLWNSESKKILGERRQGRTLRVIRINER